VWNRHIVNGDEEMAVNYEVPQKEHALLRMQSGGNLRKSNTTKDYETYIGMRFGQLTVLDLFRNPKGGMKCRCRCDCGNMTEVYWHNVKAGRTKSCGCREEANRRKYKDITGQRFGKLTVLSPTKERRSGNVVWKCRCDCGNLYYQSGRNLVRGFSKHCGCEKKRGKSAEFRDITDQKFNRLTALYPTDKRSSSGSVIWHCICDCGREAKVSETALVHGSQISCGCRVQEVGKELSGHLHFIEGTCIEFLKRKRRSDNSSGYTGVYRMENGKYKAGITFKKTRYYLGTYDTFEEAKKERQNAEVRYHQAFLEKHYRELLLQKSDAEYGGSR